jgi:predicted PurR-regulated permease PerM
LSYTRAWCIQAVPAPVRAGRVVQASPYARPMSDERLVRFRPRAVLSVIGVLIAVAVVLEVIWVTKSVLIWVLVALFLAMALNPAVELLVRRGIRRPLAVGIVFVGALLVVVGIAATFVPTLVREVNDFADAVPGYIDDITKGRGRLGFLERDYHIVERARDAIEKSGVGGVLGLSSTALSVTKSILNAVVAVVTIAFLTLFMLLEGPAWVERIYSLVPEESQPRWRKVGGDIYRTVGGYVTGNLAISLVAGVTSTIVLLVLEVPYAVALGLVVAVLDLVPLAGATIAAVIVIAVGFLHSTTAGIILIVFFIVYQQLENHVLQPLVYGRTVQLSPLVVLVAVLMGAELAGVIGALGAIPVAGSLQVVLLDWLDHRRQRILEPPGPPPQAADLPS